MAWGEWRLPLVRRDPERNGPLLCLPPSPGGHPGLCLFPLRAVRLAGRPCCLSLLFSISPARGWLFCQSFQEISV